MPKLSTQRPRPRAGAATPSYPRVVGAGIAMLLAACGSSVTGDTEPDPTGGAPGAWTGTGAGGQGGVGGDTSVGAWGGGLSGMGGMPYEGGGGVGGSAGGSGGVGGAVGGSGGTGSGMGGAGGGD